MAIIYILPRKSKSFSKLNVVKQGFDDVQKAEDFSRGYEHRDDFGQAAQGGTPGSHQYPGKVVCVCTGYKNPYMITSEGLYIYFATFVGYI